MTSLAIRFLAGRFHATPWGHHVNEGLPEWPPSPWRLLRAFIAAMHNGTAKSERALAWSALRKLASPPTFWLPEASVGHTRHYLSLNQRERSKTTLTFDAFVAVDRDRPLVVCWPTELTDSERLALAGLAGRVGYLGRAESWSQIALWPDDQPPTGCECRPSNGVPVGATQAIPVLCPAEDVTLQDLERDTPSLQREGWSDPPGTRWVRYELPADALRPPASRLHSQPRNEERPTVVELAFSASVLPLLVDGVLVMDRLRQAALDQFAHLHPGQHAGTLAGKEVTGQPLQLQHRHAHFVPEGWSAGARLTHAFVWAPDGLSDEELEALAAIRVLNLKRRDEAVRQRSDFEKGQAVIAARREGNSGILSVAVTGIGRSEDFAHSRLFQRAQAWRSRSPFVPPRHAKEGRETPEEQVIRELTLRSHPTPQRCERTTGALLRSPRGGRALETRWVEFDVRRRQRRPTTWPTGFRLTFEGPVQGPILLGWGSHYGLGLFVPDEQPNFPDFRRA